MESSDNADSPSQLRKDTKDSDAESSDDEILFKHPSRGAFKRKAEHSDDSDDDDSHDDGKSGGKGSNSYDDGDDDDEDSAFNSSPETRRMRSTPLSKATSKGVDFLDILSSDDEALPAPTPKPRHVLDAEALAEANVAKFLESASSDDNVGSMSASRAADREYQMNTLRKMAAASAVDLPGRTSGSMQERLAAMSEATEAAAAATKAAAARRIRNELSRKHVRLRVERSKTQRHVFHTKLSTGIVNIANGCRRERALLSRDEEDADLSLYYEGKLLDLDQRLLDAGITGDVLLRLEVTGEASCFSGPPISLKVRTAGGKTFTVETTMDTTFSAFMESFNAAVGVPPERAAESVFKFDGDNLEPSGTPEGEDMESGDLIDAKLPADLMHGVQASPSQLKLVSRPKTKQPVSKKYGAGATSGARGTTPAASAASAVPLGRTRPNRSTRATRSSGGGSSSSSSAVGGLGSEIVILD